MDANQAVPGAQPELSPMDRLGALLDAETAPTKPAKIEEEQDEEVIDEAAEQDGEPEVEEQAAEDESTDEEGEESEDQASALEDVEIDGKSFQVPPEIKRSLMLQQDYTKKTQALAVQQRQSAQLSEMAQQRLQVAEQLGDVLGDLRNVNMQIDFLETKVNWQDLRINDPLEYNTKMTDLMSFRQQRDALAGRKNQMAATLKNAEDAYKANATVDGTKYLSSTIKGWGPDLMGKLVQHAIDLGFSEEQVSSVINPLNVILLHESYLYRQGKAANPAAKRVTAPQAVIRPGATPGKANPAKLRARQEQRAKLSRSHNIKDAAALIRL